MRLQIKHMSSVRFKLIVKSEINKLGLYCDGVELGEANINEDITDEQRKLLRIALYRNGLELIEDKKEELIEKTKIIIFDTIYKLEENSISSYPHFLEEKLNYNYTKLANLFSEVTGNTIEHYIISLKIERVKDLLLNRKLNLTRIALNLNYSSVAHLSKQFKNTTGLTPSYFTKVKQAKFFELGS